ncbi:MAG: phosphomethylpyrimidine synthase ThiC [Methanofollis sp.]|uniref:phosphomethylpyrimidine synthase ThiC n=1 Tax=Methanofollis sp. TaxID=2052835 RepID=UPI00261849D5|nr:phosphomethylpyrimidine synthase ThiC [Methanofollis sp.]MDD4253813.1 phosphomethylpyrimidine synthase ThiC [Methanofollis sp.]
MVENGREHLTADGILAIIGTHKMEGQIAFRIAAHIGDTVKRNADGRDLEMARSRADFDRDGQVACSIRNGPGGSWGTAAMGPATCAGTSVRSG